MATFRFPAIVAGLLSLSACVGVQPSFNPEEQQVFDDAVAGEVADEPIASQNEASWTISRQTSWSSTDERSSGRDSRRRIFASGAPSRHGFHRHDRSGDGIFGRKRQESPFSAPFSSAEPDRPHSQQPGLIAAPHELQHHAPHWRGHPGGGHHDPRPEIGAPRPKPQPPMPAVAAEPPKSPFSRPLAPRPSIPPIPPVHPMPAMPSLSQNPATHAPHGFGGHHEHRINHGG
jgi:hypothetical protein